jgi:hypothetical protein
VLAEAPQWSEEQAIRALRAAAGATVDEWGDLDQFTAEASQATLRRLDEDEASAGVSWDANDPS